MAYIRAPAKNYAVSFCGKRRNNGANFAFGFTRKHWSKVCFDDIARYAFGLPNADFASRLVEETPFPQTPSVMEGHKQFMEVSISNRQKEKDRSPTHSGRRQKRKN